MWKDVYVNPRSALGESENPYRLDPPRGLSDYDENLDANPAAEKPEAKVTLGPEKTTSEVYDILRETGKHHKIVSVRLNLPAIDWDRLDESEAERDEMGKHIAIQNLCPTPPLRHVAIFSGGRCIYDWRP